MCVRSTDVPLPAARRFSIAVCGRGGHGAAPRGTVDAVVEAAAVVTALQTIVSRNVDPCDAAVVTCGSIRGGSGYNIIADRVDILGEGREGDGCGFQPSDLSESAAAPVHAVGTCRSFREDTQALMQQRMGEVCAGVAATYGGEVREGETRGA